MVLYAEITITGKDLDFISVIYSLCFGFPLGIVMSVIDIALNLNLRNRNLWPSWCYTYYKITNRRECHFGYQYKTGLNVLKEKFNFDGSCCGGGLYFTTKEHLHNFCDYGCWVREVKVPFWSLMVKDPSSSAHCTKWRADRIILGAKYPLYDTDTIIDLDLKVEGDILKWACKSGNIRVLKHGHQNLTKCLRDFNDYSMCSKWLSFSGNTDAMDWWIKSGFKFKCDRFMIAEAVYRNQIKTLEWFLENAEIRHCKGGFVREDIKIKGRKKIPRNIITVLKKLETKSKSFNLHPFYNT